jgi:hypothetical protein
MKTFEEIIGERKLHELTDDEINEIVKQMSPEQLSTFDQSLKKEIRKRKKPPTKKQSANLDEFNKTLFG